MKHRKPILSLTFTLLAAAILLLTAAPASAYYKLVDEWASPGTAIATDTKDRVYVADSEKGRIRQFDSSGNLLNGFAGGAWDPDWAAPLPANTALATDSNDNAYVADLVSLGGYPFGGIQKFDPDGTFLTRWDRGLFGSSSGIATDSQDNAYVAGPNYCERGCLNDGNVSKYDSSGSLLDYWETSAPGAIAIDSKDRVYVTDSEAGQIQKFDSSGNQLTAWESSAATAIATDRQDNVYVVSVSAILKYDSSGNAITNWPSPPGGAPSGLATDSEDNVYALDPDRNRVWKFADDTELQGSASAKASQIKRGGDIRVRVRVAAQEQLTAEAGGRIKLNPTFKLKPKSMQVAGASGKTMQLVPKKKHAKKIAKALKKGKKAKAKLTVRLTDEVGNAKTEKLSIELSR
jgi:sugar lactone lactonase YvrE